MRGEPVLWVHEPDGRVLPIPTGDGEHLRPLGWHPVSETSKQTVVEMVDPVPDTVVKPSVKSAARTRKNTLQ